MLRNTSPRRLLAPRASARGFGLVEVLVAIVVLCFGLLGMVGMQAFALQSSREARLQSQATALARELAEMMRGNHQISKKASSDDNPYLGEFDADAERSDETGACLGVAQAAAGCDTTLNVARAQIHDWLDRVQATLPGARVSVCFDAAPYDTAGMPQWVCASGQDTIFIKIGWTHSSTDRSRTGAQALDLAFGTGSRPLLVLPVTSGSIT